MNWAIVLGFIAAALMLGMIWLLRGGIIIILFWIFMIGLGIGTMWFVYKWVFPPGWEK